MAKIKILYKEANHADSMAILKEANLRPLTYQEALQHSEELIDAFKGKWKWFYLDRKIMDKDGLFTFDSKGELQKIEGDVPIDKKVYVWSGNNSLSLGVLSGDIARQDGRRFYLLADDGPDDVAPVVVGLLYYCRKRYMDI